MTTTTLLGTALGGRYRLDAQIGKGGMSTVYRAFDTVLERPVAIKLMHREIASDADQLERFRREARAVAQLSHPHIVTVIDAGEEPPGRGGAGNGAGRDGTGGGGVGVNGAGDGGGAGGAGGTPYIVFEYVDGETLKALVRRTGPLEITEALAYTIEVARALGAAHEHHIVHRDVKPQNVLLTAEGTAKITDFGIARTLTEQGLTLEGRVLGTTDYVSPEQALGHPVTGQSDIYSLGVVLYELLTGAVPFTAANPVAVAMRHVREEIPDVQHRRPEVSAATAAVVERSTAKDLARRYPDMPSLLGDLEEALAIEAARAGQATGEVTTVLRTLPGPARRRVPWHMRHPVRWLGSLALLGGLVALGLVLAAGHTHRGVAPDVERQTGPHAGPAGTDLRSRLQPLRHRTRTPHPSGQRGRRRPRNGVEHRALPAATRSGPSPGPGSTSTRPRGCAPARSRCRHRRRGSPRPSTPPSAFDLAPLRGLAEPRRTGLDAARPAADASPRRSRSRSTPAACAPLLPAVDHRACRPHSETAAISGLTLFK